MKKRKEKNTLKSNKYNCSPGRTDFNMLFHIIFLFALLVLFNPETAMSSGHVSIAVLPYTEGLSDSDRADTLTASTLISYALDSFPEVSVIRESVVRMAAGKTDIEKLWNKTHNDVSKMMSFRKVDMLVLCRFTRSNGKVKSEYVFWDKSGETISVNQVTRLQKMNGVYELRNDAIKEISAHPPMDIHDELLKNLWIEKNENAVRAFSDGLVKINDGRTAQGLSALEKLSATSPAFRDLNYFLGIYYAESQYDYMASIRKLQIVIKSHAKDSCAFFQLGFVYRLKGEYEKAAEEFKEAVKLKPGYFEGHLHLAMIYNDTGEYIDSAEQYKKALSIRSDAASVWYSLAGVLVTIGDLEEALNAVKKAIQLEPETFKKIARRDMDLAPLRVLPEFNQIIREY